VGKSNLSCYAVLGFGNAVEGGFTLTMKKPEFEVMMKQYVSTTQKDTIGIIIFFRAPFIS
jgi:hypothetical protein